MSNSSDIFDFLSDVWDLLPEADRLRFAELWKSYEQTYGDIWMKLFESGLASSIETLPLHNNQRWLKHTFDSTTAVSLTATYLGNQDLSKTLNLTARYLIKLSVNGQPPVEVDLRGVNIQATKATEIVEKFNLAFGFSIASLEEGGALLRLRSNVSGLDSQITFYRASDPSKEALALILGVDPEGIDPVTGLTFPKLRYAYQLQDARITHIPSLQDRIHDDQVVHRLTQGADYSIEMGSGLIAFKVPPPEASFWAKDNLFNLETPYNNFGYLLDLYDKNTDGYLKAVKGLWFAFWTGPRPENVRRSIYLLFGLPSASKGGVVASVNPGSVKLTFEDDSTQTFLVPLHITNSDYLTTFLPEEFRNYVKSEATPATIALAYDDGTSETFNVPIDLLPEVTGGQVVTRFQPLVTGIAVFDKVNSPGFLAREAGLAGVAPFLTEKASRGDNPDTDQQRGLKLVEQNTYLPQIDVNAFIRPDIKLSNVKTFLRNIQPKSRTFLLQVLVGTFRDPILITEILGQDITFTVDANLDYNPAILTTSDVLEAAETTLNSGLCLDSEVISLVEELQILVSDSSSTDVQVYP